MIEALAAIVISGCIVCSVGLVVYTLGVMIWRDTKIIPPSLDGKDIDVMRDNANRRYAQRVLRSQPATPADIDAAQPICGKARIENRFGALS